MSELKDLYNNAYKHFTPDYIQPDNISKINLFLNENAQTLIDFSKKYFNQFNLIHELNQRSCLELGCGIGSFSFYLQDLFQEFLAVDSSALAVSTAKEISNLKGVNTDFLVLDVCSDKKIGKKFDFIFDSHLFHCLTEKQDRKDYLKFIKTHLASGGEFLLETMAFQVNLQVPVGYSFDQEYILHKEIKNSLIPIRTIRKSIDIETEFQAAGLKIKYLFYHNELSFDVFDDYKDYPIEFCPKTIRLSATLS